VTVLLTAAIHPQMTAYLIVLTGILWLLEHGNKKVGKQEPVLAAIAGLLPGGFHLAAATGPYREALYSRHYAFLYDWSWDDWIWMLAPLAVLAWFGKSKLRGTLPGFARLSAAMVPFGLLSLAGGLLISSSHSFDMFARLQPLRPFHLIILVFMLLLGGLIGEYTAKRHSWVAAAIIVPLALGMSYLSHEPYPNSPQVEFPSATSSNAWVNALLWVRENTPQDAVFAVDSHYFLDAGGDLHGFRAISERSSLADYQKDGGVVFLFPTLAGEWKQMSNATYGLNHFQAPEFRWLQQQYPAVSWTIVHGAAPKEMNCPYQQRGYAVCRLEDLPPQQRIEVPQGMAN
jgi:hypothetical protein